MFRKIIASMLIFTMLIMSSAVHALDAEYITTRAELKNSPYASYIQPLEEMIPQMSDEKLEEVYIRVSELEYNNAQIIKLVDFIEIATLKEISERKNALTQIPTEEYDEQEMMYDTLSEQEMAQVNAEIQMLQGLMETQLLRLMDEMMVSFEKNMNYRQTGDMHMDVSLQIPDISSYEMMLKLNDYIAENQGFDSRLRSGFEASVLAESEYEDMQANISGNLDFITLGGDIYIQMGDIAFNASEFIETEMNPYIDALNELARENTYLSSSDANTQILMNALEAVSMSDVERTIKMIAETPLLEAYGKDGNAYLLRPTIEMCSMMKEALAVFDPFSGSDCTQRQYEDMLEDIAESGTKMMLDMSGRNSKLSLILENDEIQGDIVLEYSDYGIISFEGNMFDPRNPNMNTVYMSYFPEDTITLEFMAEDELSLNAHIQLGNYDRFVSMNMDLSYESMYESFVMNAEYAGNQLEMTLSADMDDTQINCEMDGMLRKDYGDFNGSCTIAYMDYGTQEMQNYSAETQGNYDMRSGKNNMDFGLSVNGPEGLSVNMNLSNIGSMQYTSPMEIAVPQKSIDLLEFMMQDINNSYE